MNFVEAYDLLKSVSSRWAHDNSYESRHEKTCLRGFQPRTDTKWAVQSQMMVRGLEFRI